MSETSSVEMHWVTAFHFVDLPPPLAVVILAFFLASRSPFSVAHSVGRRFHWPSIMLGSVRVVLVSSGSGILTVAV